MSIQEELIKLWNGRGRTPPKLLGKQDTAWMQLSKLINFWLDKWRKKLTLS